MSLSLYKEKRNFAATPEPKATVKRSAKSLCFVVQQHDASALHYDFRLEMDGVLKSWAVPKGPSLNPADKRLAMMVEDHPVSYRSFEGVIPEGNYGAGTVLLWDEGSYEPADGHDLSRSKQEVVLLAGMEKGSIKFRLFGQKLNGLFTLMRMKRAGEDAWLLIKNRDEYAQATDVLQENLSVKTGRTIAEVAAASGTTLNHPDAVLPGTKAARKTSAKKAANRTSVKATNAAARLKKDKQPGMPQNVTPMLATLTDAPFDDEGWLFEIKWDGYRAIASKNGDVVNLVSRNNRSFANRYPPVMQALAALPHDLVLDGEVVLVNSEGLADFQALQNWQNTPEGQLRYYVFDLLWLDGKDLTQLPLMERKAKLQALLPPSDPVLFYSDHVVGAGKAFFDVATRKGLEGIMAKKSDSTYMQGSRSEHWLKVKVNQRQEVVIAGYTEPRASRKFFGSLLLGVYDGKELVYIGHTGSGFNRKSLEEIYQVLQPLRTENPPFAKPPKTNMPATWVQPKLVCEIKFTEWTREGHARHPIFMGLRSDKAAREVRKERAVSIAALPAVASGKEAKKTSAKKKAAAPLQVQQASGNVDVTVAGQELTLTSLEKPYWKKEGFTKGDMLRYYAAVLPFIFPYLKDRPQSLHRYPNGIGGTSFFQKDMAGKIPDWIPTHEDFSESTGKPVHYLVCHNEAALMYMANMGCIELHPWHSKVSAIDKPDYCLLDLDPHTGSTFEDVIETALVVKKILDGAGASCYCKTSGSSGLHVYIPLGRKYSYEQSKAFAEKVVKLVHAELSKTTSLERAPEKRKGKIYLDWMQNTLTQTAACAYSLRPKPGMPVSTPLHWEEVKKGLQPTTWHARNILERLQAEGDLFAPVLGKGIALDRVVGKLG